MKIKVCSIWLERQFLNIILNEDILIDIKEIRKLIDNNDTSSNAKLEDKGVEQ